MLCYAYYHCFSNNLRIADRHRSHCNANRCSHSSEVKKIYLREIAVGTDSDFPQSRSPIVEKSRRIAFESTNDHRGNIASNHRVSALNSSRYTNNNNNYQLLRKSTNFYDARNNNERDTRTQRRFDNKRNDNMIDNEIGNKQRNSGQARNDNEENGYTPVPVKQLIQEFEKTCRPVLQYKQISPKIIPIVQQCPLDNDIARFFETRNPAAKCSNEEEEYAR